MAGVREKSKLKLEIPPHSEEASFKTHFRHIQPEEVGAQAPGTPSNPDPDSFSLALKEWRDTSEEDTNKDDIKLREERARWRNLIKKAQSLELKLKAVDNLERYLQAIFAEQNSNLGLVGNNFKALEESIEHLEGKSNNLEMMANNTTPGYYKCQYTFDGAIDSDINLFLKNFELYLLSRGIVKEDKEDTAFAQLVLCLTDSAKNYIDSLDQDEYKSLLPNQAAGGNLKKLDYEMLKALLVKRFECSKSDGDRMTSLLQIKQLTGEPVTSFVKRFINLSSKVKLNAEEKVQNSQLISIFVNALTPKLRFELSKSIDTLDSLQACEKMAKRLEPLLSSQLDRDDILYNEKEDDEEEIYFADGNSKFDKYKRTQKRFNKYPTKYSNAHKLDNKALSQKILEDNEQKIPDKITYQQTVDQPKNQNNQIVPYNKQNNAYNNNNNMNYQMMRTPYHQQNFRPYFDYQPPYFYNPQPYFTNQATRPFHRPFYQKFLVNPPRMVTFGNNKYRGKDNRDTPRRMIRYNSYPRSPNTIQYFSPIYGQTNKRPHQYNINFAEHNIDPSQIIQQSEYENIQFEIEPSETIIEAIDQYEPNFTQIFEESEDSSINNVDDEDGPLPKMPETMEHETPKN